MNELGAAFARGVGLVENGAELLTEVHSTFLRWVVFAAPEHADAVTLFTAATHAQPAWEHATRLVIKSPLKQCGKTRLQEVISGLAHRVVRTVNISSAALVRSIDADDPPTLMLDEADVIFATRKGERSEKAEDLRGIFNSGHSRNWPYIRWDATARRLEECPTYAMAVLGGIGDFPDTVEDRAVIIPMRRRAPGEQVQQYRAKHAEPILHDLRSRLHEWARAYMDDLSSAEPDLPVEDRAADTWESLVAVADAAGGDWPDRARKACAVLTGAAEPDEATASERLLADLHSVFHSSDDLLGEPPQHLSTSVILQRLHDIDEAPWGDWFGHPFHARDLAKMLKPYGVRSRNIREGGTGPVVKGYHRQDFAEQWSRYLRYTATSDPLPQVSSVAEGVADSSEVSATRPDLRKRSEVADVAQVAEHAPTGQNSKDMGPCVRCGNLTQRYGLNGDPRCHDCRA